MSKIEVGEVFTLSDENDQDQDVEVLGSIDLDGTHYIAVGLVEEISKETDEDFDVFFLKVEDNGELSVIEDDQEFEKVSNAFDESLEEED
jgi:hypothetical protein